MDAKTGRERDRELLDEAWALESSAREREEAGQWNEAAALLAEATFLRDCISSRSRSARFSPRRSR